MKSFNASRYTTLVETRGVAWVDHVLNPRFSTLMKIVLIAAVLVRLGAIILLGDINPATANTWETGGLAINSLKHGFLTACISDPNDIANCLMSADGREAFLFPSAFVPPLPILLFMGVFKLFGVSRVALAIMLGINVIGGVITVNLCKRLAHTLFKSQAIALLAATTAAFHPALVYSVSTYHGLNIYLPLILCLFDQSSSRFVMTKGRAISVGLLLGITVLIRTEYLFLGVAILTGAFLAHRRPLLILLSISVASCLIAPWTIRNYLVFHRFMPVVSTVGYALYKGFDPLANGSGHWVDATGVARRLLGPQLDAVPKTATYETDLDDVYHSAANDFIAHNPLKSFIELPVRKILLFWLFDIYDPSTHQVLYQATFWPLLLSSFAGLFLAFKAGLFRQPDHRTVLLYFLAQTVVMVGYAVHTRYRLNVEPFLFGYSSFAILAWVSPWIARRERLADMNGNQNLRP